MLDWLQKNKADFERDVLRDFCHASVQLQEQFERFDATRTLSFSILRELIGELWNKGLLWRLKDKAHHIFLRAAPVTPAGLLLDWTLSYIFHETQKLMEDAHQRQFYAPPLWKISEDGAEPEISDIADALRGILEETVESMRRESERVTALISHSRRLFCLYFAAAGRHRPLARFLNDNENLARRAFGDDYEAFVVAVYGGEPERLHIEAALSLLESARGRAASHAVDKALLINPDSADALELKDAHGL